MFNRKLQAAYHDPNRKLHLGCGKNVLNGWVNIDLDDSLNPHILPWDLRKPLPFPDNDIKAIFVEHVIECLTKEEGIRFFKECYRVLKPGAPIRIGISNLAKLMKAYEKKDEHYRHQMMTDMPPMITKDWDEFAGDMLFNWDRRYYYTPRLLKKFLEQIGFEKVMTQPVGESNYRITFDTRYLPDTSYLEARKPK